MPELPEVETVVRSLAPLVTGCRILGARFFSPLVLRADPARIARRLRGRTIAGIQRHGKFMLFDLGDPAVLVIHLGMTGKLLWQAEPGPYTRAVFRLDRGLLVYDDVRQFGRIELADKVPARIARLGPDPLAVTLEELRERLRGRRSRIKPLLLNQRFLRGLGNIYADEALFRSRIHPQAVAARLSRARVQKLYEAIRAVLDAAIASGGSSISDYVDSQGREGFFQFQHQVYGRANEPCPCCGAPIRRIVLGGRGTHFCPRCQRS